MSSAQMEALDFRYLLLEYYKKLNISESELAVLLMMDHLLGQKNALVTPDLLSVKMNLSMKELDKIVVGLMNKGFVAIETGKKVKTSLKPLRKKLYDVFEEVLAKEHEINKNSEKAETVKTVRDAFAESLNRNLFPLEVNMIHEWVYQGCSEAEILEAFRDCLKKGQKTLKDVDKILLTNKAKRDLETKGATDANTDWDNNIERAMEIAKTKWVND